MKNNISFITAILFASNFINAQLRNDYAIQPVDFTHVHVTDNFWAPKINTNATVSIPYTLQQCKKEGRIDNFFRAAGILKDDKQTTYTFDDTDLYKVIEGASYSLQASPNESLSKYLDTLISYISNAQEKDGYLYTFRTMQHSKPHEWLGKKRWELEEDLSHELYNAGHLYEASVAHFKATGKRTLLNIAIRNADLLVKTFGEGREQKFPGHQVVEMGLAKLYRVTGKKEYLQLAKFFLDLRGKEGHMNREYSQSHIKVTDQHTAVGHAVRATYMYSGMADIAALTGDKKYLSAIDDIWKDVAYKKIYITGGIGATGNGEAFGKDYDLPNMSAYAETCASIANVYWNLRMFLLHGDAKYIDVMERTLYNGLLSGVSLSGDKFFYPNPLASIGQHQRSSWFDCACCITNMTRFLPSMPGYVYAQNKNSIYVNLFVGSTSTIQLPTTSVEIIQQTNYPWNGTNELTISPSKPNTSFALHVRIPGWAINKPIEGGLYKSANAQNPSPIIIYVNGKPFAYNMQTGYAVVNRKWKKGDKVSFTLPMNVEKIFSADSVAANTKRFALQSGPIVYCLEGPDNTDSTVRNIIVDKNTEVKPVFKNDMLNGVMVLQMQGMGVKRNPDSDELIATQQPVTAIPYYAWANRGDAEMKVWIPYEKSFSDPKPAPSIASKSKVSSSLTSPRMHRTIQDQYEPQNSNDRTASYLHWWPKKNTTEWVQYDFDTAYTISSSSVYWFDDGPWGGCRIPLSWKLLYKKGNVWVEVKTKNAYPVTKDGYDTIEFEPVTTTAIKLQVQLPREYAAGIHEWIIK